MNNQTPPPSYRVQDGCHNCKMCYARYPYDDPYMYFCTSGQPAAPTPPPNYDPHDFSDDSPSWLHTEAFQDWMYTLPEVNPAAICDHHGKKIKTQTGENRENNLTNSLPWDRVHSGD